MERRDEKHRTEAQMEKERQGDKSIRKERQISDYTNKRPVREKTLL